MSIGEAAAPAGAFEHATVLLRETVDVLEPRSGGVYADVTLGGAGHAVALLERSAPEGRLLGIDRDRNALNAAEERLKSFADRVTLVHGEMADLPRVMAEHGIEQLDGVIADLGVSSPQFDRADRGFSFSDGPLDMRMDQSQGQTAEELIRTSAEAELADIIYQYGEERRSRPIARSIKRASGDGRMRTTGDLVRAVHRVTGPRRGRIEPATRTFQALRIAVNDELAQLRSLIKDLPDVLSDGGVAAIISFHSLEDRIVKHAFRDNDALQPLFKKPVVAGDVELQGNPRSRSAKMRAARRLRRGAA